MRAEENARDICLPVGYITKMLDEEITIKPEDHQEAYPKLDMGEFLDDFFSFTK